MRTSLFILSSLIALTCGMRHWLFNLPPRIMIYDIFVILFICISLIYELTHTKKISLRADLRIYLLLLWLFFFIGVISGLKILSSSDINGSFSQYLKAFLINGTFAVFATFFIKFLSQLDRDRRNQILSFYIYGVLLSSFYGIIGTILYKTAGLRIEAFLWDYVSYNSGNLFEAPLTWTVLGFRRGVGFPGVAAGAAYNMTILPLLLLFVLYRGRSKDYLSFLICFAGFIVIMSRAGIVSLMIAIGVIALLTFKVQRKFILRFFVISLPILITGYLGREYIKEISLYRGFKDLSRFMQWESGLQLFFENPVLGVGMNNFSIARNFLDSHFFHDSNLHNSWLTVLVELGVLGLACYIFIIVFVVRKTLVRNDILHKGFVSAIIGLSVGAIGNQLFDLFFFKFFMTLMFAIVTLDPKEAFKFAGVCNFYSARRSRRDGSPFEKRAIS